jgi:nucleotide-binding universal stress UspA family protein
MQAWEQEPSVAREYLNRIAERLHLEEGLIVETTVQMGDPASVIVHYAEQNPSVKLISIATHGRKGVSRWVFGSVAEKVLHASPVPLLMVRSGTAPIPVKVDYHTIMVPLDGSAFAEQALDQAQAVASSLGASVVLVTAIADYPEAMVLSGPSDLATMMEDNTRGVSGYLDSLAEDMKSDGMVVQTRIEYGPPAESILKANEEANGDLIVMSTHGRSGLRRMWLGSVALRVMRGATCPVLLVRAKERVPETEDVWSTQPALAT